MSSIQGAVPGEQWVPAEREVPAEVEAEVACTSFCHFCAKIWDALLSALDRRFLVPLQDFWWLP